MKSKGMILFSAGVVLSLVFGWFAFPALLYKKIDQPVQFSHKIHTGESVGLSCEECHSFRTDGRFTGIPKLEKCAGCHAATLGTTPAEKLLVEEYVVPNKEIPWKVYSRQPDNAYFSHVQHVRIAKIECDRCHGPHGKSDALRPVEVNRISGYSRDLYGKSFAGFGSGPSEGMKMDDCTTCHAQHGIKSSCLDCHK